MGGEGGMTSGDTRVQTVYLVVHAHVVPDGVMTHAVLLGRDRWADFPVRTYVDTSPTETVVTFTTRENGATQSHKGFSD